MQPAKTELSSKLLPGLLRLIPTVFQSSMSEDEPLEEQSYFLS